jgi:hypothetical protein
MSSALIIILPLDIKINDIANLLKLAAQSWLATK